MYKYTLSIIGGDSTLYIQPLYDLPVTSIGRVKKSNINIRCFELKMPAVTWILRHM